LPLEFANEGKKLGIAPEQMKQLMGVIDKYISSQKEGTETAKASLFATPESQDAIDAKEKEKMDAAAAKFETPYPMPGVAFDTFFVDEVKKSVDAITKTSSKPMEAISSFTGLLQLEGQLANFLSAIAEGTFANEDVRAMVTNGLKSYITSYIATMILDKEGNVLKEISKNSLPSTAVALLDKIRTQVAVPRAPIQSIAKAPAVQTGELPKAAPSGLSKMYTSVKDHVAVASSHLAGKAAEVGNTVKSVGTQALANAGIKLPGPTPGPSAGHDNGSAAIQPPAPIVEKQASAADNPPAPVKTQEPPPAVVTTQQAQASAAENPPAPVTTQEPPAAEKEAQAELKPGVKRLFKFDQPAADAATAEAAPTLEAPAAPAATLEAPAAAAPAPAASAAALEAPAAPTAEAAAAPTEAPTEAAATDSAAPAAPKTLAKRVAEGASALAASAKKKFSAAEIVEPEALAGPYKAPTEIEKMKQTTARANELAAATKPVEKLELQKKHAGEDLAAAKQKTATLKAQLESITDPEAYKAKEAELAEHENVVKGHQDEFAAASRAQTKKSGSYLNAAAMNTTDFVRGTRRTAKTATDMVGEVTPGATGASDRQLAMSRARDVLKPLSDSLDKMSKAHATEQLSEKEKKELASQKETRNRYGSEITATQQAISQKMREVVAATQALETLKANPDQTDAMVMNQVETEKDNKKEAEADIARLKTTLAKIKEKLATYNESKMTSTGGTRRRRRAGRSQTKRAPPRRARPKKTKARPRRRATARRRSKRNQTAKGRTRFTSEDMLF
jgi:hypothetical protein